LKFFWGVSFKILDGHYKVVLSTEHRAKFHANRPTHLGDFALTKKTSRVKHKSFRNLSFSGGLKNIWAKTKVLSKTIVFGRIN